MAADSKRVLVIDDDTALRTAYSAALSKLGYEVDTAADGLEGQQLVKDNPPDVILLDMLMPNMDGEGFIKQLHGDPERANIKVVVVSNFEASSETEAGVSKFLSKMQNTPEAVADAVDRVLKAA